MSEADRTVRADPGGTHRSRARKPYVALTALVLTGVIVGATIITAGFPLTGAHGAEPVVSASSATTTIPAQADVSLTPELTARLAVLERDIENLRLLVNVVLGVLALLVVFVVGGGVVSLAFNFGDQRRAKKAFTLAFEGETKAQARATDVHDALLASSQQTIGLVNDTLALAKEASEQAAKTLDNRARQIRDDLDREARSLLDVMYRAPDFKEIVENPEMSAAVQQIASKLASLEGYLQVLDIPISGACHFVQGIDRHLKEEPQMAIHSLTHAAQLEPDTDLALFANYWIGYESNNLGQHEKAADTFRRLVEGRTDSPRTWELARIGIESEFFQYALEHHRLPASRPESERQALVDHVAVLGTRLRDLLDRVPQHDHTVRSRILTTLGNTLFWRAQIASDATDAANHWRAAADVFQEAGSGLWARFGYLEAMAHLGNPADPSEYQWVVDTVMEKVSQRVEPRSKVLLFATRLIAYCRQPERTLAELDSAYGEILQATGRVNPLMRVFSQFRKFNLSIKEANEELRTFYRGTRVS